MNLLEMLEIEGIKVKRSGKTYRALCPFHPDRDPSFVVWPDSNQYYCFGCGVSGDAIQFLRDYRGLSFPEAARVVGVEIGRDKAPNREEVIRKRMERNLRESFQALLDDIDKSLCQAYRGTNAFNNIPNGDDFVSLPRYYAGWHWADQKLEYWLDIIQFGSAEEKVQLAKEMFLEKV